MKNGEKCKRCGLVRGAGGPDPCLVRKGLLPGVLFACCGHENKEGYIAFENGTVIRFENCTIDGFNNEFDDWDI